MAFDDGSFRAIGLVRPGRAVGSVMVTLSAIWLMFAIAVNWAGAGEELFYLFCGNTERILHGEVWRLFTAPLMHVPSGTVSHILWAVLGFLFLAPSLEQRWGSARTVRFLLLSGLIAYAFQMGVELALPDRIAHRLVGDYWFGSFPVLEAVAIAWALSFRGQVVRLFMMIPVTSSAMVGFVVAMSVLRVIAAAPGPEGLLSPFGGMFAGWLLGAGTPSPLRRAYLKLRVWELDREAARGARRSKIARGDAPFRVIEGGRAGSRSPEGRGGNGEGPSGRMLH